MSIKHKQTFSLSKKKRKLFTNKLQNVEKNVEVFEIKLAENYLNYALPFFWNRKNLCKMLQRCNR